MGRLDTAGVLRRSLFRAIQLLSNAGRALVELLLRVFPTAQLGLWIIVGADLVRARIWEHAADQAVWMRVLNRHGQGGGTVDNTRRPEPGRY